MWWWATALAADLSGVVAATDGEPVVGATITAYDVRFNYGQAITRTDGQWDIGGLPAGSYRVRVQPSNADSRADSWVGQTWAVCDATVISVTEDEQIFGLDVNLETGGALVGQVLDIAGQPVEGAVVTAVGGDERTALVQRYGRSDTMGEFAIRGH